MQRLNEDGVGRVGRKPCRLSKERYGGVKFEVVGESEDAIKLRIRDRKNQPGAVAQPSPEDGMREIGDGFIEALYA